LRLHAKDLLFAAKRSLQQFLRGAARLRAVFQKWISVLVTSTGLLATLEFFSLSRAVDWLP
jgi:hypothetical protein